MQLQQIALPLGGLPLNLICLSNGLVAIQPIGAFKSILEALEGIPVVIASDGMSIGDKEYRYGEMIEYKQDENMLKWLKSLNMEMPNIQSNNGFPQGFPFGFH